MNEIDRYNILQATKLAMKRAIYALRQKPDYILIDAVEIDELKCRQQAITGGDALSATIAAASIIAKVTRDRLMCELDRQYPGYGFAEHKGYPTRRHREAITKYGPCPLHRRSFYRAKKVKWHEKDWRGGRRAGSPFLKRLGYQILHRNWRCRRGRLISLPETARHWFLLK